MSRRKNAKRPLYDGPDLMPERSGRVFDPEAPDVETGIGAGTASANEMTGLIPSGSDLTDEEYELSRDLFPFGSTAGDISGRQI